MAKPDVNARPGQGGRFAALKAMVAGKGIENPGGLAAAIGRKKYGKQRFSDMAQKGREESK